MIIHIKKSFYLLIILFKKTLNVLPIISKLNKRIKKLEIEKANIYNELLEYKSRYNKPVAGSEEWMILTEFKYGGLVKNVPRNKVSIFDKRTKYELNIGGMIGGDRMSEVANYYAPVYALYMKDYVKKEKIILAEVGILKGIGIAMWSDLFPHGKIIGLDIDLDHIINNLSNLKKRGAFTHKNMELYEFDQFVDNHEMLKGILKGDKISIFIDDGVHADEAIIKTMLSVKPHLADNFLYIIEDNKHVHKLIRKIFPEFNVKDYGALTVVLPL